MLRKILRSKIHKAIITHADVMYEGSITIPPELLERSGIAPFESVEVWNVTNGNRLQTYTIAGVKGSRDICINGAAAHLCSPGDEVIIACFCYCTNDELYSLHPVVIFLDNNNEVKFVDLEIPGPQKR
jgi:aspartate 1-decarboxylase